MPTHRLRRLAPATLLSLAVFLAPAGCGASFKRNPLPSALAGAAVIPGAPDARTWADTDNVTTPDGERRLATIVEQATASGLVDAPSHWLVLSGGGANGAYGAGLLVGWTERGDRPQFSRVTGVSTGALIAPFAFLGPAYDDRMREVYTTVSTKDIVRERGVLTALNSDAFTSTKPLQRLLAKHIDGELLDAIAAEHRRGRRLVIVTTNLDALRPVAWDLGAVATSDAPNRVELARNILLASASIPGAMPPVYFEVEAGGRRFDEMHVDGGATAQLFTYAAGVDARAAIERLGIDAPTLYIIRNARLDPEWETVRPRLGAIIGRTITSLIRTQGLGDLYQSYLLSQRDGFDFRLAYIPEDFDLEPAESFDPVYMTALFERGRAAAADGYPWATAPPGYDPSDE
ncbi:MAG: patatin-like phospholipase family protein [Phycisphaerales bacterium]